MKKALLQLHTAVFLAGFTGILGKLIELNEGLLVWYRILLTVITLFILLSLRKQLKKIPFKKLLQLAGVGGVIALHWVTFYGSIKYGNVSIALVCFSSIGFFTAIAEPLMLKTKFSWVEILLGLLTILGIYLIFNFNPEFKTAIIIGMISSLLAVVFTILNKKLIRNSPVETMTFYELAGGFVLLSVLMPFYLDYFDTEKMLPDFSDWMWLLVLAWFCTVLAFMLQLHALKKVSTFTSNLTYNLEPVYGIALAFLIYKENRMFDQWFYIGLGLIILAVGIQMYRVSKLKKT